MYICDMCKEPIAVGTQYVNAFDKNICLDCAVRNSLDDVMAIFGITYTEAPDEIVAEGVIVYENTDSVATPEQVENFFHSENPTFVPTQVGEKNTVLTTLCARSAEHSYKKAWIYGSSRDAEYFAEHYLKNMPNLLSIDGFVSEEEIPDDYIVYRVDDGDNNEEKNAECGMTAEVEVK